MQSSHWWSHSRRMAKVLSVHPLWNVCFVCLCKQACQTTPTALTTDLLISMEGQDTTCPSTGVSRMQQFPMSFLRCNLETAPTTKNGTRNRLIVQWYCASHCRSRIGAVCKLGRDSPSQQGVILLVTYPSLSFITCHYLCNYTMGVCKSSNQISHMKHQVTLVQPMHS